jgi:hypothetical protein
LVAKVLSSPETGFDIINTIGIYTSFLYFKYNHLLIDLTPSPAGEGWGEENKVN